jgi:hypothetical protein
MISADHAILSLYQATQGVYQQQVYSTVAREFIADPMLKPQSKKFMPDPLLKSQAKEFKPDTTFDVESQFNK